MGMKKTKSSMLSPPEQTTIEGANTGIDLFYIYKRGKNCLALTWIL